VKDYENLKGICPISITSDANIDITTVYADINAKRVLVHVGHSDKQTFF